jgi:hypothetical protein
MRARVSVSIKDYNGDKWGDLASFADSHDICGEKVKEVNSNYSFIGGHRVRLYRFKKNVHWMVPKGTDFEITDVSQASSPRRQGGR